jgi:hypothetical protein
VCKSISSKRKRVKRNNLNFFLALKCDEDVTRNIFVLYFSLEIMTSSAVRVILILLSQPGSDFVSGNMKVYDPPHKINFISKSIKIEGLLTNDVIFVISRRERGTRER